MNVASGVSDMTSGGALGVGGYGSGGLTVTFCVGGMFESESWETSSATNHETQRDRHEKQTQTDETRTRPPYHPRPTHTTTPQTRKEQAALKTWETPPRQTTTGPRATDTGPRQRPTDTWKTKASNRTTNNTSAPQPPLPGPPTLPNVMSHTYMPRPSPRQRELSRWH